MEKLFFTVYKLFNKQINILVYIQVTMKTGVAVVLKSPKLTKNSNFQKASTNYCLSAGLIKTDHKPFLTTIKYIMD